MSLFFLVWKPMLIGYSTADERVDPFSRSHGLSSLIGTGRTRQALSKLFRDRLSGVCWLTEENSQARQKQRSITGTFWSHLDTQTSLAESQGRHG
ncbi:hypothetical protein BC939DRAFT_465590 [Gamsiella multidivaricata]|uniref:uncharacterized protein n=1 Tax=Gamsiella multidivaricata TaxID=101098 RepID=UPI00221F79BC|nr:uncharacterized protein BC939DRAFT_465590 [Gamsiella multidivaricata]KAI7817509.1 hypothetical protein BC939DRAFT_465590 [Gamsiella multidivaricata]